MFGITQETIETFALIFTRITLVIAIAPLFGMPNSPLSLKAGLSFFITILVFPFIEPISVASGGSVFTLFYYIGREAFIGLLFGFVSGLIFQGIRFAGQVVSFQMGFILAQVFDPQSGNRMPILSQFYFIMAFLLFLIMNGHHVVLNALAQSFQIIPLGSMTFNGDISLALIRMGSEVFIIAVKIASPVLVTLLLTDAALGIIARTVPQMNIFFVGMPVKIAVGFLLIIFSLSLFPWIFQKLIQEMETNLDVILKFL